MIQSETTGDLQELVERHRHNGAVDLSDPKTAIPKLAKDPGAAEALRHHAQQLPTRHALYRRDARSMEFLPDQSVHLVLTSPPYWTLKEYRECEGQLGHLPGYDEFLDELDRVWAHCFRVLVEGGRLIIVVGDVCVSRKKEKRHYVAPLHASIQERCRALGFDNLAPIIWHKIANARFEVENGTGFFGKPYEPNGIIKNDIEYILMQRKPGSYRKPSTRARLLSVISEAEHRQWFRQIWELPGASTSHHPAPYPVELAERLIRMYSFAGDTLLDPFLGTGTTSLAASLWGRNSVGVEVDPAYFRYAVERLRGHTSGLFPTATLEIHGNEEGPR
jgi:modification methylase